MVTQIVDLLIPAGTALLSVRLYTSGLRQKYRAFFYYLIFSTLQTGYMLRLDSGSRRYVDAYVFTEPISWIFYALVVLELYSLVLADYQGLYTVGRWALIIAVTLALLASALSLLVPSHGKQQASLLGGFSVLVYYYVAERAVYLSLIVFLLTILFVLLQYPITLKRNIVVHLVAFLFYFLGNTVVYLVLSTRGKGVLHVVQYPLWAITLGSLGAWLALLNPTGEMLKVRLRPTWMPGREEELVSQLNSLNAALLRAARK
jgi:hypothetical protein